MIYQQNSVIKGICNETFYDFLFRLFDLGSKATYTKVLESTLPNDKSAEFIVSKDTVSYLMTGRINQAQLSCHDGQQGLLHGNAQSRLPANQCRHTNLCLTCKGDISTPSLAKPISCQKEREDICITPKGNLITNITIPIIDHWTHDGKSKKGSSHPEGPAQDALG